MDPTNIKSIDTIDIVNKTNDTTPLLLGKNGKTEEESLAQKEISTSNRYNSQVLSTYPSQKASHLLKKKASLPPIPHLLFLMFLKKGSPAR